MTDISDLLNKVENEGKTPAGRVSAAEFNRLVTAVGENQGAVHKVTIDNVEFTPDSNGNVTLIIDQGTIEYSVGLTLEAAPSEMQMDDNVSVNVKISSTAKDGGETIEMVESCRFRVLTSNDTINYIEQGYEIVEANKPTFTTISLKKYLHGGVNYLRFIATSSTTNTNSLPRSYTINVVNLSLIPNTAFEVPFTQFLQLNYLVGGAISKNIQFQFGTGLGSSFEADYDVSDTQCTQTIGTSTNVSTGMTFEFTDSMMLEDLLSSGVHTIRARLISDTDSSFHTDWVESQYMVASESPLIVINNVESNLTNWTDVHFFDWAVSQDAVVVFRLADENDTTTYSTWQFNASTNTKYSFTTQLGVELQNASVNEFYGYMHIEDTEGNELTDTVFFTIANSASFIPTSGADLIITPSNRNNSEANPARVINNANGNEISSTFTNFGFITDGWMNVNKDVNSIDVNAQQVRALHIPSGRSLDIDYNPFSSFTSGNNTGQNVTMEIDFRTSNILDSNEPIFKIGNNAQDGDIWGFQMLPTKAYLATERARNIADQDTDWAEDTRTHLAVNVVYNLGGLNYVRIFINGIIEREFNYDTNDRFTQSGVHMVMGNNSSDLDIFGIRVYKKSLSTEEVMRDYRSSLSTATEKVAFQSANDILDGSNNIDWYKCLGKYNIIGHTGHLPKYGQENKGKASGISITIKIVGDEDHSGTINNLESQGQGTTAMTYYDWNQQYKITSNSVFVCDNGTTYPAGGGYAIQDGEAKAKKLVGKINFASSMQSHKLGLTWIFTDLYKRLVSKGQMTQPTQFVQYPSARISVLEKPFLFFHRETANDEWTFKYLMTFGAAKGDKPTFGFNADVTGNMLMVEGANNDRPLALFAIPWNDDIAYDPDEEAWMYNGEKQLNFGLGEIEENNNKEYPSNTDAINAMKAFFNFTYLHHTGIEPFSGTITELKASGDVSTAKLYWVTQGTGTSERYDLYRYDHLTGTWVDAGIAKNGTSSYAKLNLRSQYEEFCAEYGTTPVSWTVGQWTNINDAIKAARRYHFAQNASDYVHVDDALYHSCFVKFFAATDNRAKNTYYYTDPGTLKIRFMQDDLDTTIKTNNVGQNRKPYYVEEHDKNASGEYYWQGESSGFYNVLEEAFANDMTTMMRYMLSGMAELGGTAMGFLQQYFLSTQDYFPAIAYNEQARLVYEAAAIAQNAGIYQNSAVQAITQSVGSQRWSEYQWLVDRLMYISSWCEYGEFAGSSTASGGLSWRGTNATYTFTLTPAKWLYPRVGSDSSNHTPSATSTDVGGRVRVQAGQPFTYKSITYTSDATISIRGINYYIDIGDMNVGLSSAQGVFSFGGRRLQKITINPNGTDTNNFLATGITLTNATNIKELTIRGVDTVSGAFDLSKCSRLENINLSGTTFTIVSFPASNALTTAQLPATIATLSLTEQPNLASLTFDASQGDIVGGSQLTNITIHNNTLLDTYNNVVGFAYNAGAVLEMVDIDNVNWTTTTTTLIELLAEINAVLKGTINISGTNKVTFDAKRKFFEAWGEIDDITNDLYISYVQRALDSFEIYGNDYLGEVGYYTMEIVPNSQYSNAFKKISWSLASNQFATIDSNTGIIHVASLGTEALAPTAMLTCIITLLDDTQITSTKNLGFYPRSAHLGDYVYFDGTYSDKYDPRKTVVGICFYIDNEFPECRMMLYPIPITAIVGRWGLDNTNSGIQNITLIDNPGYDVYNTPLRDYGTTGFAVNNSTMRNQDNTDFKDIPITQNGGDIGVVTLEQDLMGKKAGEQIFWGQYNTLLVIQHRNTILNDSAINLLVPSEIKNEQGRIIKSEVDDLIDKMAAIASENGSKYEAFYYPLISYAYAFEPSVSSKEVLNDKFKRHNWWMLSQGEMARFIWYYCQGFDISTNENAIFAEARRTGVFPAVATGAQYATSSEANQNNYRLVNYQSSWTSGNSSLGIGNTPKIAYNSSYPARQFVACSF